MEEELKKYLRAEMNAFADRIALGGVADWAEYRFFVGKVQALAEVERELLDLMSRAQEAEK